MKLTEIKARRKQLLAQLEILEVLDKHGFTRGRRIHLLSELVTQEADRLTTEEEEHGQGQADDQG